MPTPYTSIFDSSTIITRKDLCELLNLDTTRPGLKFSPDEIKRAYKIRAMRFHPDKQAASEQPVPIEISVIVTQDLVQARDYMLAGTDNIPGKYFVANGLSYAPEDWVTVVIDTLNGIKENTATFSWGVTWLSRFSNDYLMILLMSTFLDGQLDFRFISMFSNQLAAIRPHLEGIDGTALAGVLRQIKDSLNSAEEMNSESILMQLHEILPESLTKHEKFDTLVAAFKDAGKELKSMLTDEFINNVQHIVHFWPNFIANVPTWKHIMGVYFVSLIATSSSLPKFFNALKVITEVILEHKGGAALALTALPLLLLTALVLPVNIVVQIVTQFAWVLLQEIPLVLINGFGLLASVYNLLHSLFPNSDKSFSQAAFSLFESALNLSVRLSLDVIIGALDAVIFILTNHSVLGSLLDSINISLDTMLDSMRPVSASQTPTEEPEVGVVAVPTDEQQSRVKEPAQFLGFFANSNLPLHNQNDVWLTKFLTELAVTKGSDHDDVETSTLSHAA